jgi:hypothetical protein
LEIRLADGGAASYREDEETAIVSMARNSEKVAALFSFATLAVRFRGPFKTKGILG